VSELENDGECEPSDVESADVDSEHSVIACIGPVERHKGFLDAIWAFDMLRHLHTHLRLWIVGDGPDALRLKTFVRSIGLDHAVTFWGERPDIRPFVSRSLAVWVPSRVAAGRHTILEAAALGRPVLTSQLPGLAELVNDGHTGFLVPPGEKNLFAKRTHLLVQQPQRCHAMGLAGKQLVKTNFGSHLLVQKFTDLIHKFAA
jgi:glycosyltransferase involved in cell wall biosynthesis